jgi:hypothetical protein
LGVASVLPNFQSFPQDIHDKRWVSRPSKKKKTEKKLVNHQTVEAGAGRERELHQSSAISSVAFIRAYSLLSKTLLPSHVITGPAIAA